MAGYDITILNTIRDQASTGYQDRIPVATRDNITAVGNAITTYTPDFNEFTSLLGKIGMTIVSSKMSTNHLASMKKGAMPNGIDIEEIFVKMAGSEGAFDPTGANPLGRRKPEIVAMYHRENRKDKYVVSISKQQAKGAFTSDGGVQSLLNDIVNSIYSGDTHDEYVLMKELFAHYETNYFNYELAPITDELTAKAFVKTVRKAVADLKFDSILYNKAGVMTSTPVENQVLVVNKDVISEVDVEVLAKAFNLGKTDFEPAIIVVDDFGSMTDTYGVLCDKDFLMVYDTLMETAEQFNADGLFSNIFLHHHQVLSTSQFKNAARFTTADVVTP